MALVERLLRVAAEAPPSDKLRWLVGFSRAALAHRRGAKTQAEQELVALLPLVTGNPALETDLLERLATLEPLEHRELLHWWLPRQPDTTPNLLSRLLALSQAFEDAYQLAVAITLAQTALSLAERLADQQGTANALRSLGDALWAQGKAEQAKAKLREAREISAQIQYQAGQLLALKTLIAIAEAEGATIVAKEYQVAYQQVANAKR